MKLCKPIIALLSAVLVGSSLNMTSAVASADTIDEATILITEKIKDNKWVYPFKAVTNTVSDQCPMLKLLE